MRIGIEARQIFRKDKSATDQKALDLIHGLMSIDSSNDYYIFVAPGPDADCLHAATNFHVVELAASHALFWEQLVFPREVERYALDVLHCTSSSGLARTNTKTLITLDDEVPLLRAATSGNLLKRIRHTYRRHLFQKVAKSSWGLVAGCHYERQLLSRRDAHLGEMVRVIHPGISNFYLYDRSPSTRPAHLPENYILCFGSVSPLANMRNILKGYELYTKMSTKAVMPLLITNVTSAELQQMLSELSLERLKANIQLIEDAPQTMIPTLYRYASMLLSPVLRDANGHRILEAMACGTVVLTSNTSCLGEIGGKASFLVNPFSAEEISHGIYKILHDREARDRMVEKSHERVKHYMWPQVARRYQNLYMEMMADEIRLPFGSGDLIPS